MGLTGWIQRILWSSSAHHRDRTVGEEKGEMMIRACRRYGLANVIRPARDLLPRALVERALRIKGLCVAEEADVSVGFVGIVSAADGENRPVGQEHPVSKHPRRGRSACRYT